MVLLFVNYDSVCRQNLHQAVRHIYLFLLDFNQHQKLLDQEFVLGAKFDKTTKINSKAI